MTTSFWPYNERRAVLYSEDNNVWEAAKSGGLLLMCEYRRPDGVLFAKQFIGKKETILSLTKERRKKS